MWKHNNIHPLSFSLFFFLCRTSCGGWMRDDYCLSRCLYLKTSFKSPWVLESWSLPLCVRVIQWTVVQLYCSKSSSARVQPSSSSMLLYAPLVLGLSSRGWTASRERLIEFKKGIFFFVILFPKVNGKSLKGALLWKKRKKKPPSSHTTLSPPPPPPPLLRTEDLTWF